MSTTTNWVAFALTALLASTAIASDYPTAKVCTGYKTDLLKLLKPGFHLGLKKGAVACATPHAYDEYTRLLLAGKFSDAHVLERSRVCFKPAGAESARVRVLRIANYPQGGGCVMEVGDLASGQQMWTDLSMFDEILATK